MREHIDAVKHHHKKNRTDQIEIQMYKRCLFGIFGCPDGGEHRRHAGADVLPHNDGDRRGIGDRSGLAQCLQNTDRGGRTLDDRRQYRTGQKTQNRL